MCSFYFIRCKGAIRDTCGHPEKNATVGSSVVSVCYEDGVFLRSNNDGSDTGHHTNDDHQGEGDHRDGKL